MSNADLADHLEALAMVMPAGPSARKLLTEAARRLRRPGAAAVHRESQRVPEKYREG